MKRRCFNQAEVDEKARLQAEADEKARLQAEADEKARLEREAELARQAEVTPFLPMEPAAEETKDDNEGMNIMCVLSLDTITFLHLILSSPFVPMSQKKKKVQRS